MAAVAEVIAHPATRRQNEDRDPKEIVAVILADGSVRDLRASARRPEGREFPKGRVSGDDWILWWERRSF